MKFGSLDLDFPEKGLVLVQGINTSSGGTMASVGSGKTGCGEAICRTLLGIRGRFDTAKQYSLDKAGDMYVKLEVDFLGKPLIVETGYKCKELSPTGDALRYTYEGKEVQRGRIQQTREDLVKLIGVPSLLAEWTVFIDGENLKFNKLSQGNCVDLVMSALRQPPWNSYFDTSKAKLGQFHRDMERNVSDHEQAGRQVISAEDSLTEAKQTLKEAQEDYDAAKASHDERVGTIKSKIKTKQKAITTAQELMQEIKRKLKLMEDQRAEASHKLEIRIHETEDTIADRNKALEPLSDKRDAEWDKVTQARSDYDNYRKAAENCPTCNRPMGTLDPKRLASLRQKYLTTREAYDQIDDEHKAAKESIRLLTDKRKQLSQEHLAVSAKDEVEDLSGNYEELEEEVTTANTSIQNLQTELADMAAGPTDAKVVEAKTLVRTDTEYLEKAKAKFDTAGLLVAEDKTMEAVMVYWNKAFSPYGIPNMVLSEAIKPLNTEARRVSAMMTGGTIEVRFSTTRELASGQDKAQLNIEVDNKLGDKDLAGSSKGEAGLTNFIISETLSEVGQASRRVGFRWYDEIVPHQDPKVCASMYAYMKELAEKLGILVFLVDHNPVAANYADLTLIVEKQGVPPEVYGSVRWG